MKTHQLYKWIFASIILISTVLPIDLFGAVTQTTFETEQVSPIFSFSKTIFYQKAVQINATNHYLDFNFNHYLFQNNTRLSHQFKQITQREFLYPTDFKLIKIVIIKNSDNQDGLLR